MEEPEPPPIARGCQPPRSSLTTCGTSRLVFVFGIRGQGCPVRRIPAFEDDSAIRSRMGDRQNGPAPCNEAHLLRGFPGAGRGKDSHGVARPASLAPPSSTDDHPQHKGGNIEKPEATNQRREQRQKEKQGGGERRSAVRPPQKEPSAEEAQKDRPPIQGIQTDVSDKHHHEKRAGHAGGQDTGLPFERSPQVKGNRRRYCCFQGRRVWPRYRISHRCPRASAKKRSVLLTLYAEPSVAVPRGPASGNAVRLQPASTGHPLSQSSSPRGSRCGR